MRCKLYVFLICIGCSSSQAKFHSKANDKKHASKHSQRSAQHRSPRVDAQLHEQLLENHGQYNSSFMKYSSVEQKLAHDMLFTTVASDTDGQDASDGDGKNGKKDKDEDEEDEDEDGPPWEMSRFDKIWLQIGWLIQVVVCLATTLWLKSHWPYKRDAGVSDGTGELYSGLSVTLYNHLWSQSSFSVVVNYSIVIVALLNFFMFACQTEEVFDPEGATPLLPDVPLSAWVTTANQWVQHFSVFFFASLLILRMLAAQAHPNFRRYGGNAWWRWLLGSIYAQIDIIAIIPSLCDMILGRDDFLNLIWLSLARTINWVERTETSGIAIRQLKDVLDSEGQLLATMFMFGTVLWILLSGFYFLANKDNEVMLWEAAVSQETGEAWQRFESVPSSMFFVLINLCKENPLADNHVEFWSRLLVVTVCFIGTPIFALPTGVLGATIQNKVQDEIDATTSSRDWQGEDSGSRSGELTNEEVSAPPTWGAAPAVSVPPATRNDPVHPLLQCFEDGRLTAFLSFGSVVAYFYYTAGRSRFMLIHIYVGEGMLAWIDGIVGFIFAGEWLLRLVLTRNGYICSFLGAIDLVAWLPGVIHLFLYCAGGMSDSMSCMWLLAACVLRVLKCERHCRAFHDMCDILNEHQAILKATLFITSLLWMAFTTLLYYTERDSTDEEIKENYGSAYRALWAEVINLHGEWVWCDYSATGKGICTIIALFSQGLFMIPICVFSDGFQDRLGNMDQLEDSLDVQPWQSHHRPPDGYSRRSWYDLLYAHLHLPKVQQIAETRRSLRVRGSEVSEVALQSIVRSRTTVGSAYRSSHHRGSRHDVDTIPRLPLMYKVMRLFSISFVCAVTISTAMMTIERMHYDNRNEDWAVSAHWTFYIIDFAAAVFFVLEFLIRFMAIGCNHPCSFVGICDVVSLLALLTTLTPFRRYAFHPTYDLDTWILDDMIVPLRLLRLFCLDSYLHPLHTLSRIVWVQRQALLRSFYALVSFWWIFGTLLYLFEWDPEERDKADAIEAKKLAKGADLPDLIMAQRFRDILSGLQYALVHLTGDYPITEFTDASRIVHVFGILFGMCMVSCFTGIFVSGFMSYLKSERIVERRQEADRRLTQVMFTVLLVQRQFRRLRHRRMALEWARNAPEGTPLPSALSALQIEAGNVERRQAQLRSSLRNIIARSTPEGQKIMFVCNAALIVNVVVNLIATMPEVRTYEWVLQAVDFIQLFTGYIFVLEYMMHLGSSTSVSREILKPMRLIDFFCLIPTFVLMFLFDAPARWREEHPRFAHLLEVALVCRILRVLDFPVIRRSGTKAFRAVFAALGGLVQPMVLALIIWITSASLFMWVENVYDGRDKDYMNTLPDALYWTSIYIIGEWAHVDFSPGAGSRMCIFYCLFGVAVFAVPVGLMMEAVESTLTAHEEERKLLHSLLSKKTIHVDESGES